MEEKEKDVAGKEQKEKLDMQKISKFLEILSEVRIVRDQANHRGVIESFEGIRNLMKLGSEVIAKLEQIFGLLEEIRDALKGGEKGV